ncbi:SIR2 family protein [Stappia sp. ES.058]|uniref:SIR2 family protein n=1 Tax=Stappia sp. ES.058 TaxID=1881061 RepID=UPI00087B7531|nr:SIR2 family protein [Stappia sp. ES.058]SDU13790.1 SIR2-like domain-containing protein [Stappia sp. ES.058]
MGKSSTEDGSKGAPSATPAEEKANFFEELREQLRYWPYTIHQIDDTLDMSLIEGKGKQLLFQAINSRNLTTFIGSGFSAGFGRLSWQEWKDLQTNVVSQMADSFVALIEQAEIALATSLYIVDPDLSDQAIAAGPVIRIDDHLLSTQAKKIRFLIFRAYVIRSNDPRSFLNGFSTRDARNIARWIVSRQRQIGYARADITRLRRTFDQARGDSGEFPGGESLPVLFEIAQQLHDLLQRQSGLFLHKRDITPADRKDILERNALGCLHHTDNAAPIESIEKLTQYLRDADNDGFKKVYRSFTKKLVEFYRQARKAETQMPFSDLVKVLLVDETAHAEQILLSGLSYDRKAGRAGQGGDREKRIDEMRRTLNVLDTAKLGRRIPGIRQKPDRYTVLTPFRCKNIRKIIEAGKPKNTEAGAPENIEAGEPKKSGWEEITDFIEANLHDQAGEDDKGSEHDRTFLTPSSRFLAGMLLALVDDPLTKLKPEKGEEPTPGLPELSIFDEVKPGDFRSRRSILSERLDPLVKTARKLKISRFLTTNYDFEIERYFQDAGYRRFEHDDHGGPADGSPFPRGYMDLRSHRSDSLGGVFRDLTFRRETASDLVGFSVSDEGVDASVFHLHGRASKEEDIVVTEADYMDLYLRRDAMREMVDEGISIAFSGAPTLFLGLGMTEADLLRPLRQFISDRDREVGYTSIVLLPAEKDEAARAKTSTALYLRYGVHTIFYGGGQVTIGGVPEDIDWLHKILTLVRELTRIVNDRRKALENLKDSGTERSLGTTCDPAEVKTENGRSMYDTADLFQRLEKALGKLNQDDTRPNVLAALFGRKRLTARVFSTKIKKDGSFQPRLVSPTFTPVRYKASRAASNAKNRHGSETVDGTDYLDFYLLLLTHLARKILSSPDTSENLTLGALLRDLKAQKIALDGIYGALLTGSLNASLDGLEKEWRSWWERWQQSPPHRLARFERVDADANIRKRFAEQRLILPRRFIRYRIDSVITNLGKAEKRVAKAWPIPSLPLSDSQIARDTEYLNKTGVRAADTFLRAVYLQRRKDEKAGRLDAGRRYYTIAAHRGLGKGCLMSIMNTRLGLSAYMRAAWPEGGLGAPHSETPIVPVYFGAVFINLSFSTEVASVYDMLIDALDELALDVQRTGEKLSYFRSGPIGQFKDLNNELHYDQGRDEFLAKLRKADEKKWRKKQQDLKELPRTLRLRNALETFDTQSRTLVKARSNVLSLQPRVLIYINGVELLIERNRRAKNAEIHDVLAYLMSEEASSLPVDIIATGAETGLGDLWRLPAPGLAGRMRTRSDKPPLPALHPVRIDRPGIDARGQESTLRRSVASGIPFSSRNPTATTGQTNLIHFARPMKTTEFLIDNFFILATALFVMYRHRSRKFASSRSVLEELAAGTVFQDAKKLRKNLWATDKPSGLAQALATNWDTVEIDVATKVLAALKGVDEPKQDREKRVPLMRRAMLLRYRTAEDDSEGEWREIRRHLGSNRFCMTLLLAAAQRVVLRERTLLEGARKAEALIFNTVNEIRNVSVEQREQTVLRAALDTYARFHVIGDPENDIELHQKLLRSLAVIGSPVSANVLVRLPDIRAYFRDAKTEFDVSRRRTISQALHTLAFRGLCFRLHPHPQVKQLGEAPSAADNRRWPAQMEYRFALHRIVQRYGISRLGSGTADPVAINNFSPSLYASMPSGLPRLSHEAYEYLRGLLVGLSQYPDIPHAEQRFEPWIFSTDDKTTRVEALRAALTMVRSTFSVAVVSRFEDYKSHPASRAARKRGYFETYKVRLRWVIRMAWELLDIDDLRTAIGKENGENTDQVDLQSDFRSYRPDLDWRQMNALHRDEIVWLYNEAGLTCLVQGNLTDAVALLRQAIEFNRGIEGREDIGRQHNRISLNLAIVQIERGRLSAARTRLRRIRDDENVRGDRVYKLAVGYLGLIDHLMGNVDEAKRQYDETLAWSRQDDDVRASAVFLNHRARLEAAKDPVQSLLLLREARQFADSGGHEDVRRHIVLSEIRIWMLVPAGEGVSPENAMQRLREVEDYAELMGAPSLACEALHLRARIVLESGEASTAGKLLIRAMAIARRNAMTLRLNSAMTTYALSLLHRGRPLPAERLLYASLEMAKHSRYNSEIARVQRVLESPEFLDAKSS